jgi:hypothetical protein
MKLPTTFQLAGTTWKVVVREMTEQGLCDFETATIYIRKSLAQQVKEAAFYHELMHAIKYTLGHALPHDETEVDSMGNMLHQFIISNK